MKYVSYLRVSTQRQGKSGLGIEAQKKIIDNHLGGSEYEILQEFVEYESGKRSDRKRKELKAALEYCKQTGATLIVAKIDRLMRNLAFLTRLLEQGVPVIACDIPQMHNPAATKFVLQLMANIAEYEADLISERTTAALAAKKARGAKLGSPTPEVGAAIGGQATKSSVNDWAQELKPLVQELRKYGCNTIQKISEGLQARGAKTFRGNSTWALSSTRNLIKRLEA
jgi:DNA invertase Pin-like site-specific DNA recombinase